MDQWWIWGAAWVAASVVVALVLGRLMRGNSHPPPPLRNTPAQPTRAPRAGLGLPPPAEHAGRRRPVPPGAAPDDQ